MTYRGARRGFTLIELLVVLLIIGIASGVALLAFGDFGTTRKIKVAAEQFTSYVKVLQQRAILESNTFGIRIGPEGYATLCFNQGAWQNMPENSLFHWHSFPKNTVPVLRVAHRNLGKTPDIIINPSGDMTEFQLDLGPVKQDSLVTISGRRNGAISLQDREKK